MAGSPFIRVGRLAGAHGIRGGLKLVSYAESLDVFGPGRPIRLGDRDGRTVLYTVAEIRPQGRGAVLFLAEITDRSQAQALSGWELLIEKASLPALPEGTYYWDDLIGLEVTAVGGARLGRLESILATGANDVYVVRNGEKEVLVPALKSVIKAIDLDGRRMEVVLPEGLDED